ncbi:MAG TPA: carboxypeptidase-like regulatory domain-containing protein [Planctomycetota bacterium]
MDRFSYLSVSLASWLFLLASAPEARAAAPAQDDVLWRWEEFFVPENPARRNPLGSLPDLDGDGFRELLLGDPNSAFPGSSARGTLYVLSGTDVPPEGFPPVLRVHHAPAHTTLFGMSAASVGDGNGDGFDEYACRSTEAWFLFDGRDGRLLFQGGPGPNDYNKGPFHRLGDLDGDGGADFMSGHEARSGRTLQPLFALAIYAGSDGPTDVYPLGDLDCDGTPDFAASNDDSECDFTRGEVYSGRTGSVLYSLPPSSAISLECAPAAVGIGDANGDSCADLVSGAPPQLLSGPTGAVLDVLLPEEGVDEVLLTASGYAPGDLDGNGVPDFLAYWREWYPQPGESLPRHELRAFDGATRELLWRMPRTSLIQAGHDWNGDGFPDLLVREPDHDLVLRSGAPAHVGAGTSRAGVRVVGSPCGTLSGLRIGASGPPFLGRRLPIHLSGVAPGTPARLLVGELVPQSRCAQVRAATTYLARAAEVAPGVGVATVELELPADVVHSGTFLWAQWVVEHPRLRSTTAALELQLGPGPEHPTVCVGSVAHPDGTPVAGATVEVVGHGRLATSDAQGRFRLEDVAIQRRGLQVIATAEIAGVRVFQDFGPAPAVPGGVTDIGELVLRPGRRTLVFGDGEPLFDLEPRLEVLGYTVVRQLRLPHLLAPYEAIWHVGAAPLDELERSRLVDFVAGGGGLYLSAGLSAEDEVRASLDELLRALVPGATVGVETLLTSDASFFRSDAPGDVARVPHALGGTESSRRFYPLTGLAPEDVGSANSVGQVELGAWMDSTLIGGRGRLIVTTSTAHVTGERPLDNLQSFLAGRSPSVVAGTVRLANGARVPHARVQLVRHGFETRTGPDGRFQFSGVPGRLGPIQVAAWTTFDSTRQQGLGLFDPEEHGRTGLELVLDPRPLVLVFGTHQAGMRARLAGELALAGVPTERLVQHIDFPPRIGAFTVAWHLGTAAFSAGQRAELAAFVRAGGALQLSGENGHVPEVADGLEALLADLGLPEVRLGGIYSQSVQFDSEALDGLALIPNVLQSWNAFQPTSILGVPRRNILARISSQRFAAAFDEADLPGGRGRLALLTDSDWLMRSGSGPVVANLQRFLERASPARPADPVVQRR